jgi:hypothetical protein
MGVILAALLLVNQTPDGRGEVALDAPKYQGQSASAPIPAAMHIRNEGGSNGAGLCVIASVLCNGRYQGVPALKDGKASELWRGAKSRPGGYYPGKLRELVEKTVPGETYASFEQRDPTILDTLSRKGLPIGATMSTGAMYNYRPIHHMISLVHYRTEGYACVVDNNDPGHFRWMPAAEFARRWVDGATGWAWIWTRRPGAAMAAGVAAWLLLATAAAIALGTTRRRRAVLWSA